MKTSTFLMIVFFIGLLSIAYMHEQVHVAIYAGYGIHSEIKYFEYFPDIATVAEATCPSETCELAHNINEAIAYPFLIFFSAMMIIALCIVTLLEKQ